MFDPFREFNGKQHTQFVPKNKKRTFKSSITTRSTLTAPQTPSNAPHRAIDALRCGVHVAVFECDSRRGTSDDNKKRTLQFPAQPDQPWRTQFDFDFIEHEHFA